VGLKGRVEDPTSRSSVCERRRLPEDPLAEGATPDNPPCEEAVRRVLTEALLLEDPGPKSALGRGSNGTRRHNLNISVVIRSVKFLNKR
jgi:hypothetical protein